MRIIYFAISLLLLLSKCNNIIDELQMKEKDTSIGEVALKNYRSISRGDHIFMGYIALPMKVIYRRIEGGGASGNN